MHIMKHQQRLKVMFPHHHHHFGAFTGVTFVSRFKKRVFMNYK